MGDIDKIMQEDKEQSEVLGVPSEVAGVPEGKNKFENKVMFKDRPILIDEDSGRRYILDNFGGKRFFCEVVGCDMFSGKKAEFRCRKHRVQGTGTLEAQEIMPEIRLIQKFIKNFLKSAPQSDPKIHIKLNELDKSVSILNDKMTTMLTTEQLRQAGFYFGSILFQYITDGNRYEMAKKDYLDCLRKIGCFTAKDMESIDKSGNTQPTPVS